MKTAPDSEYGEVLMLTSSCGFWISGGTGITGEELSESLFTISCSFACYIVLLLEPGQQYRLE